MAQRPRFRRNRELTKEELRHVEDVFRQRMTHERKIHIDDFKKMIPAKNVSILR